MSKKTIDMVAITPEKANAQHLTCFVAFVTAAAMGALVLIMAFVLPAIVTVTPIICWISMMLEAFAAGLGYIAFWIYKNTL